MFPAASYERYPASEVDPVSKTALILGPMGLYVYDPVTKTKTRHIRGEFDEFKNASGQTMSYSSLDATMAYDRNLVYAAKTDRFYYMNPPYVYELNYNRATPAASTLTLIASSGTSGLGYGRGFDYDSVNNVIVGGLNGNAVKIFNLATRTWSSQTVQGGSPGDASYHVWKYDPVNNVFYFGTRESSAFWAYRYK